MIVYAESSAVLSWLLGEEQGEVVRGILARAEAIVASDLTLIECDRCLIRAHAVEGMSEQDVSERRATLNDAAAHWNMLTIDREVVERARDAFPVEPIHTLDALHLATAEVARSAIPDLRLLSLDSRVRDNASELDFKVEPLRSEIDS